MSCRFLLCSCPPQLKTFLREMKDCTTIVADNKEELKTCTSKCYNTPECQKTTTAKPTTTTSKYPLTTNFKWTSGFVSAFKNYNCIKESPYGRPKYSGLGENRTRRTCRNTRRITHDPQKSRGLTRYEKNTCYFECTTELV